MPHGATAAMCHCTGGGGGRGSVKSNRISELQKSTTSRTAESSNVHSYTCIQHQHTSRMLLLCRHNAVFVQLLSKQSHGLPMCVQLPAYRTMPARMSCAFKESCSPKSVLLCMYISMCSHALLAHVWHCLRTSVFWEGLTGPVPNWQYRLHSC